MGPAPILALRGERGLGLYRPGDRQTLRVFVRDHRVMTSLTPSGAPHTPVGLSLVWYDAEGQPRCRYEGGADDHVPERAPRVAEADVLVRAFLAGEGCP